MGPGLPIPAQLNENQFMSLSKKKFWEMIDSTRVGRAANRKPQVAALAKRLSDMPLSDIGAFKRHLDEALTAAYTFPLIVACFVVHSRVSDDQFLEFRAWLILHGRAAFEKAIENPDSITKFLAKDQVDEINCAGFPELPIRLWLDRGGDLFEFTEKVGFTPIPNVKQDWPENRQEFEERYPVLYRTYWNPGRIKAFAGITAQTAKKRKARGVSRKR